MALSFPTKLMMMSVYVIVVVLFFTEVASAMFPEKSGRKILEESYNTAGRGGYNGPGYTTTGRGGYN